jgi:hypothetical protein
MMFEWFDGMKNDLACGLDRTFIHVGNALAYLLQKSRCHLHIGNRTRQKHCVVSILALDLGIMGIFCWFRCFWPHRESEFPVKSENADGWSATFLYLDKDWQFVKQRGFKANLPMQIRWSEGEVLLWPMAPYFLCDDRQATANVLACGFYDHVLSLTRIRSRETSGMDCRTDLYMCTRCRIWCCTRHLKSW